MSKKPAVYIMASRRKGALYIGVTSDLVKRIQQHRNDEIEGFTKKYGVHRLVHFERNPRHPRAGGDLARTEQTPFRTRLVVIPAQAGTSQGHERASTRPACRVESRSGNEPDER